MALITMVCPNCGGQAQIEAGRSVMCPYCGKELSEIESASAFAYAPEMQQNVQFAPPPAPDLMQMQQSVLQQQTAVQQPAVMPVPVQQEQFMTQQPLYYTPDQLRAAQNKRKNWHIMNSALIGLQSLMMAFGILLTESESRFGVPLILTWLLTTFGFGAVSGISRPDDAYIEKKPFCKSRFGQGVTQFWMGAAISSAVGGILFAILAGLLGML